MVPLVFGLGIDFAQLVKVYDTPPQNAGPQIGYSPGGVVDSCAVPRLGLPDMDRVCTSHAERGNLSMRMTIRRLTRLTNAHSKTWTNHSAALALYFGYYNYCRSHMTLTEREGRKTTPAMASGLTDHAWTVPELLQAA